MPRRVLLLNADVEEFVLLLCVNEEDELLSAKEKDKLLDVKEDN